MENSQHTPSGQVTDSVEAKRQRARVSLGAFLEMAITEGWDVAWDGWEPGSGPVEAPPDPSG